MSEDLKQLYTFTAPVRTSWPQVITPHAYTPIPNAPPKGDPYYNARFVFHPGHPDLQPLLVIADTLLRRLAPTADFTKLVGGKDFWYPFAPGEREIEAAKRRAANKGKKYQGFEDYMAGATTLYAKSVVNPRKPSTPPQLSYLANGRFVPATRGVDDAKFYNGMNAAASVSLVASRSHQGWGISCYLNAIGAYGTGERIGQRDHSANFYVPPPTGTVSEINPLGVICTGVADYVAA